MDRHERMLNALVPVEPTPLARRPEPPSARGMLRWSHGSATVIFAFERYDARERAAIYRLCVNNTARQRLTCGLWSARADGSLALAFPNPIAVEALGSKDVRLLVPVDRGDPFRYALLTIRADGLAATFEAPGPPLHRVRRPTFAAPVAAIGAIAVLGALLAASIPRDAAIAPVAAATPRPAPRVVHAPIASIARLDVSPVVADAGATLHVAYEASAERGDVELTDTSGTVWARAPFSHGGETTLRVPPFSGARDLRVVLRVRRGTSVARSASGVLVRPANAPAPASSDSVAPIALASATVRAGAPIDLAIRPRAGGLRLALTDDRANELATLEVRPDASHATLRAPNVTATTRYYVVASYEGTLGDESSVLPVTVTP